MVEGEGVTGRSPAVGLLMYAQLRRSSSRQESEKFLRKNRGIAIALGLDGVLDRTTIGLWKRRQEKVVKQAFRKISKMVRMLFRLGT
ncbi:hypothetical protein AKJ63_01290 [candidate division MSBL1 archaeon SCGC-AAA259D18]|uniref:Uncharacterized protein n=1 Tax=candidate division MSBL1 archaeon SCGC-AAA259D18 TaxID=1698262 RepID=A0A133UBK4_9EURY|nr:hypothetical protein AKJ63_01290 [candidate division MSBL1 archaeon SCGC-AAA259D18]